MAVKLTTSMRCQYYDESCHLYRHVNNFTNASSTIKFSTFSHTCSTACMYFIAERRPYILKSWFLLKAIFNFSAKFIWRSHYSIHLTIPSPYIWNSLVCILKTLLQEDSSSPLYLNKDKKAMVFLNLPSPYCTFIV